jgi:hypothetical protein
MGDLFSNQPIKNLKMNSALKTKKPFLSEERLKSYCFRAFHSYRSRSSLASGLAPLLGKWSKWIQVLRLQVAGFHWACPSTSSG